jgi:hypothetical protein
LQGRFDLQTVPGAQRFFPNALEIRDIAREFL